VHIRLKEEMLGKEKKMRGKNKSVKESEKREAGLTTR